MQKLGLKILASVAIVSAALSLTATPAAAQRTTTLKTGNFAGPGFFIPGTYGGGFVSYFSTGMRHNGRSLFTDLKYVRNRTSSKRGRIIARWNGNSGGDDYVTGLGWNSSSVNKRRRITYNVRRFNPSNTSGNTNTRVATMGVYGWLCPTNSRQEMVEYYVVDSWFGSGSFVPFQGSFRKTARINGQNYRFYSTPTVTRGNGCRGGNATFRQLWAVRTSKKTNGTRTTRMDQFFNAWNGVSGTDTSAPAGYQIVAVEGIGGTKGSFDVEVNN